jgi:hypothetical protein
MQCSTVSNTRRGLKFVYLDAISWTIELPEEMAKVAR